MKQSTSPRRETSTLNRLAADSCNTSFFLSLLAESEAIASRRRTVRGAMPVRVALDWLPNSNHAGFYIAKANEYFSEEGVDAPELLSPHIDNYHRTPAQKLAAEEADLALVPSETVISSQTQPDELPEGKKKPELKAIAAVLSRDASALVAKEGSGVERPRDLDGKRYASYGARFEGRLVKRIIRADGGSGEFIEDVDLGMLGAFDALVSGKAQATWVFLPWEGVLARRRGINLRAFQLQDFGVPYCYSPVIAAPSSLGKRGALRVHFLVLWDLFDCS